MKITVLGAGAWGTALAKVLHENGNAVALWDIDAETLEELRHGRSERRGPRRSGSQLGELRLGVVARASPHDQGCPPPDRLSGSVPDGGPTPALV